MPRRSIYLLDARSPIYLCLTSLGLILLGVICLVVVAQQDDAGKEVAALPAVVGVLALVVGSITVLAWIRRIGVNSGDFGWGLVVAAMVPWETLVPRIARPDSVDFAKVVVIIAMMVTFLAALLVRRPLITKMWRAGDLPAPLFAELGWICSLASTELIFAAVLRALNEADTSRFIVGNMIYERTTVGDPDPSMVRLALLFAAVAGLIFLITLIAATFSQHDGIRRAEHDLQERAEAEARRRAAYTPPQAYTPGTHTPAAYSPFTGGSARPAPPPPSSAPPPPPPAGHGDPSHHHDL